MDSAHASTSMEYTLRGNPASGATFLFSAAKLRKMDIDRAYISERHLELLRASMGVRDSHALPLDPFLCDTWRREFRAAEFNFGRAMSCSTSCVVIEVPPRVWSLGKATDVDFRRAPTERGVLYVNRVGFPTLKFPLTL